MEDIRQQQIEAIEELKNYNKRLVKAVREIIIELKGEDRPDTEDFLKQIVEGINWEIQVVNGTLDYINEDEILLDKEQFNQAVLNHNEAINTKDDTKLAESFEVNILPYLLKLEEITEKKLNN
ncbi:MAG: molecular chaperone [Lachnospiraceae bacterium]|nr:molecular chaperone [Lachnospiraceae bacterium]MDE6251996.1 molecular chaperone [Lachnospiraceae bacterium]